MGIKQWSRFARWASHRRKATSHGVRHNRNHTQAPGVACSAGGEIPLDISSRACYWKWSASNQIIYGQYSRPISLLLAFGSLPPKAVTVCFDLFPSTDSVHWAQSHENDYDFLWLWSCKLTLRHYSEEVISIHKISQGGFWLSLNSQNMPFVT